MCKNKKHYIIIFFIFIIGCLIGFFIIPKIGKAIHISSQKKSNKNIINKIEEDSLYNIIDSLKYPKSKILNKKINLFVFWTPTCPYCQEIFKYNLNDEFINIYGIPCTEDMEYLKYYCNKNNIKIPQFVKCENFKFSTINITNISIIPQFWIVNSKGFVEQIFIGNKELEELLQFISIYKENL